MTPELIIALVAIAAIVWSCMPDTAIEWRKP